MSANFNNPTTATLYAATIDELKDRDLDIARGLDPAVVSPTNLPASVIRWSSAANKWEKYNGTTWADLAATYAINISGTASNVTGTVLATKGGTGQTAYAVGDILYANTTTTLARRAAVAVGNVLLSAGVGAAPVWGKADLTPTTGDVTGTLGAANGGTGQASYAVGDLLYASTTTALSKLAAVAVGNVLLSNGTGAAPVWGKVDLTTGTGDVAGTLAVANGGTGATTAAAARTALGVASDPYIYIRDQKTSGTAGGSSISGNQTRTLNTEVADTGGNATLSANQITLAAGTYRVRARAPALNVGAHKLRLRNITAGTTLLVGASGYTQSINEVADSLLSGRITVAASQVLELQQYTGLVQASTGLGSASSTGEVEVYAEIEFWKEV